MRHGRCGILVVGGVAQWLGRRSLADFPWYAPDLWLTCDHFVGKASAMGQPTRPTRPPRLLPSVGRGMSSISVARWVKLLAAVSPSSECLYEGKADVVYLFCVIHIWALSGRDTDDRRYTSPLPFLYIHLCWLKGLWERDEHPPTVL